MGMKKDHQGSCLSAPENRILTIGTGFVTSSDIIRNF